MSTTATEQLNRAESKGASDISAYTDVIVAVHGIGDQFRNATVRSVANRLAQSRSLRNENDFEPLAPQPLGYFSPDVRGAAQVRPLDRFGKETTGMLKGVGFTEVFWADIPQTVDREGSTLEETKAWARTIIARARATFLSGRSPANTTEAERLKEPDFSLAAEVLDEIIETVQVLENLSFLAEKAGIFKFDLQKVLRAYLGDVQIVTEFTQYRRDIVGRFQQVMTEVHKNYPDARLHIVAHSEGTVVSFLGLLHAMSRERLMSADSNKGAQLVPTLELPGWLHHVHGYMTIGSPLDKHLLLWPYLFDHFKEKPPGASESKLVQTQRILGKGKIKWRNYYDYGDPVGFELNTLRRWLQDAEAPCTAFEFEKEHDIGFARYMLPGKAHNDYWADAAVFEHFVSDVIAPKKRAPKTEPENAEVPKVENSFRPRTRGLTYILSPSVPYALSALLLIASVFIFYRAVVNFMEPPLGTVQNFVRYMTVGVPPPEEAPTAQIFLNALTVAALIAGTTLLSRWPRLTKEKAWWWAGATAFALGCVSYALMPAISRNSIGDVFIHHPEAGSYLTFAITLALALLSFWLPFTKWAQRGIAFASLTAAGILAWIWNHPHGGVETFFSHIPGTEFYVTSALVIGAFCLPWCERRIPSKDGGEKIGLRWWPGALGVGILTASCIIYNRTNLHVAVDSILHRWYEPATYGTLCAALLVALVGMTSIMPPRKQHFAQIRGRRTRWFRKGMRPLILCGACAVAALVFSQADHRPPALTVKQRNDMLGKFLESPLPIEQAREKANQVMALITIEPPVWPVLVTGVAFLYLWWLSALIFDMAFVWQRYVRRSRANERLEQWQKLQAVAGRK